MVNLNGLVCPLLRVLDGEERNIGVVCSNGRTRPWRGDLTHCLAGRCWRPERKSPEVVSELHGDLLPSLHGDDAAKLGVGRITNGEVDLVAVAEKLCEREKILRRVLCEEAVHCADKDGLSVVNDSGEADIIGYDVALVLGDACLSGRVDAGFTPNIDDGGGGEDFDVSGCIRIPRTRGERDERAALNVCIQLRNGSCCCHCHVGLAVLCSLGPALLGGLPLLDLDQCFNVACLLQVAALHAFALVAAVAFVAHWVGVDECAVRLLAAASCVVAPTLTLAVALPAATRLPAPAATAACCALRGREQAARCLSSVSCMAGVMPAAAGFAIALLATTDLARASWDCSCVSHWMF
eukprot:3379062-Rhodomonas_salina.2